MLFRLQAQMGSGYSSSFRQGQQSISSMRQELRGLSEEGGNLGGSMTDAFGAVKGAIAASGVLIALKGIYEGIEASVEASIEFESAMTGVAKTSDMSEKELAAFSEEVKELATVIPVTTTELGSIAETAGQLGIADDNLLDFTTIMAELGTATTMTADEAATMLAQFANITQMSPDEYDELGSTIVDLGNNFATTEQKITDMAQGIAAAGSLAGMNEADMMGLSAAVTSLGMETQAGSTAMSKLIADMSAASEKGGQLDALAEVIGKPVEEIQKALDNDKADKALKKFANTAGLSADEFRQAWSDANDAEKTLGIFARTAGMSADEFKKAWGADATGVLTQFITGLNDTERNGKSATLVLEDLGITEVRMLRMILSLSKSGDLMNRALSTANNAWEENTALQTEAEKRYNTTESKLVLAKNAWNNLQITIGDKFTPALSDALEIGTEFLEWIDDVIKGEGTLEDQVDDAKKAYDDQTSANEAAGVVALGYIGRLEELEAQGLHTNEAQEEYHRLLSQLVTVMPELNELIDLENDSIKGGTEALRDNTKEWLKNAVIKAQKEQIETATAAVVAKQQDLIGAETALAAAQGKYDVLVEQSGAEELAAALGTTVRAIGDYISPESINTLLSKGFSMEAIENYRKYSLDLGAARGEVDEQEKAVARFSGELEDAEDELIDLAGSANDLAEAMDILLAKIRGNDYSIGAGAAVGYVDLHGYANGLAYVPRDNFPALLHEGERVLTASEASEYNNERGGGIQIVYSPVVNGGSPAEIEAILRAHSEDLLRRVGAVIDARDADRARRAYR